MSTRINTQSLYVTVRGKAYSFLISKKAVLVSILLLIATLLIMVLSTGIGSVYISPVQVIQSLFGFGEALTK